jgi:hypothetical protein
MKSLPPGHPLEHLLRQAPDFKHVAAVADALLNPQDRAYSVPQLFEFLAQGGLRFGRWLSQAPYSPRCGAIAKLPQAGRIARLAAPDQFAAIELFRGTMVTHSVVACRDDHPHGALPYELAADSHTAWRAWVPLRLPDTICVQERLPPGATAVLINRTHTYRDLVMPIDATEKRLFDRVDGVRTLGEIAQDAPPRMAQDFFERLGWWDQVVFDKSRSPAGL